MRFSTRSKLSILFILASLLTLVGGFVFYGASNRNNAHAASVTSSYAGVAGQSTLAGSVNPTKLPAVKNPNQLSMVNWLKHQSASGPRSNVVAHARALVKNGSAPKVTSSTYSVGKVLQNFDGVDAITNDNTSNTPLEPPDEALAVGQGYVMNLVNVTGAIYRPHGSLVIPPFYLNNFFAEPPTAFLSDPRAFFDKTTNTWFAEIIELDIVNFSESHIDLAVNSTGNPLNAWNIYRIDTTDPTGYQCPCFADYTILATDQYDVYLSGNEFSLAGNAFNGDEIYAVSKSQLVSGVTANYVRFGSLSIAGAPAYHVQPAQSYGLPNAGYFMSSLDPNGTFDNRLAVWAMTNRQSITTGVGMPNLTAVVINSEAYGFPVNAVTPPGFNSFTGLPTTGIVQSDFDAMQEVEYINGHLVGALNTSVTIPGDTSTRDGIAWFQVTPHLGSNSIKGAQITEQGYVSMQGEYMMYPHINQAKDGTDVMVFTFGGPNTYLSAAYVVKSASARNFGAVKVTGAGVDPDNGFTGTALFGGAARWGDYSNGQLDPYSNNIWFATQYIPNNGDQFANWGNRIFEVAA